MSGAASFALFGFFLRPNNKIDDKDRNDQADQANSYGDPDADEGAEPVKDQEHANGEPIHQCLDGHTAASDARAADDAATVDEQLDDSNDNVTSCLGAGAGLELSFSCGGAGRVDGALIEQSVCGATQRTQITA